MPTRATLESTIADDLARSDMTSQITYAVDTAVRAYEFERFWFNEAYRVTATLSSSVATIPMTQLPVKILEFDRVRLYRNATVSIDMYNRDYDWIMSRQDAITYTQPAEYCIFANAIQFDSYGNANYTFLIDGVKSLGNVASDTYSTSDSSSWFSEARELIRHRAKREVYANVIKDMELAAAEAAAEQDAFDQLKGKTNSKTSTGFIRPTEF